MRELIDVVAIQGRTLQITAHGPQAVDPPTLAVATALRVFVRYPVLDRLVLSIGADEIRLSRGEIERLLGGEGFAALQDRRRWRQILARVVQAYTRAEATGEVAE